MTECHDCRNERHYRCKGGAWDERLRPVVCSCFALHDHYRQQQPKRVAA